MCVCVCVCVCVSMRACNDVRACSNLRVSPAWVRVAVLKCTNVHNNYQLTHQT